MIFDQRDDIIKFWNMCDRHMLLEGRGRDSDKVLVREIINYMDNEAFVTLILTHDTQSWKTNELNNSPKIRLAPYNHVNIEYIEPPLVTDLLVIDGVDKIPLEFIRKNLKWRFLLILSRYDNKIPTFFSGNINIVHLE